MNLKQIFAEAIDIIYDTCDSQIGEDLKYQCKILRDRAHKKQIREQEIINSFIVSASSYRVTRNTFKVLSPETIYRFDFHFSSNFFNSKEPPAYQYAKWMDITLAWGNGLLSESGIPKVNNIYDLVYNFKTEYQNGNHSLSSYKPKPRIILSLATGLPILREKILPDPNRFFSKYDSLSLNHPGKAYDAATRFSGNKKNNSKISGMSTTMICDFFKNIGLLYYAKIDIHLKKFLDDIAFGKGLNKKEMFILSWLISKNIGIEPFYVDKILFIGGKFAKQKLRTLFLSKREEYLSEVNALIDKTPYYYK